MGFKIATSPLYFAPEVATLPLFLATLPLRVGNLAKKVAVLLSASGGLCYAA
jgi:hypothetical protein